MTVLPKTVLGNNAAVLSYNINLVFKRLVYSREGDQAVGQGQLLFQEIIFSLRWQQADGVEFQKT